MGECISWMVLQVLHNNLPAVEVQQKASPAKHEEAIELIPVAKGRESRRPMMDVAV